MTDVNMTPAAAPKKKSSLLAQDARTRKRNAAETRFRMYGMAAIGVGLLFLVFLFASILRSGLPAFTQTVVDIEFTLTQEQFDTAESKMLKTGEYQKIFINALTEQLDASGLEVLTRKRSSGSWANQAAPSAAFSLRTPTALARLCPLSWRHRPVSMDISTGGSHVIRWWTVGS